MGINIYRLLRIATCMKHACTCTDTHTVSRYNKCLLVSSPSLHIFSLQIDPMGVCVGCSCTYCSSVWGCQLWSISIRHPLCSKYLLNHAYPHTFVCICCQISISQTRWSVRWGSPLPSLSPGVQASPQTKIGDAPSDSGKMTRDRHGYRYS